MSNYATLKAAIQSAVYTNGNNEITGVGLQSVLLQIVNALGDGYVFKGMATAGTAPGTPDGNVFYLAQAGTYTNFGNSYTVPDGGLGVFLWDGAWHKGHFDIASSVLGEINLAGYFYNGVITPQSVPPSQPVKNTFWIAQYEGTYTNYGGLTIDDYGLYIISWLASSNQWKLTTVIKYKEDAVFDSGNLATSGALYDEKSYSKMLRSASNIDGEILVPAIDENGYYIEHASGNLVEWNAYNISQPIQLLKGQTISYFGSVNKLISAIARCSSTGTDIVPLVEGIGADPTSSASIYTYTAPEDCYVRLTLNNSTTALRDYKNHSDYSIVTGAVKSYKISPFPKNGYYNREGAFVAHDEYITRAIYPSAGDIIDYSSWMTWQYNVVILHFDGTLSFVGSYASESLILNRGQYICDATVRCVYVNTLATEHPTQEISGMDGYNADTDAWAHLTTNKQQLYDSVLTGKTWCAVGDSVTAAINTTYVGQSERTGLQLGYQNIIADRTGMQVYTNAAGGRTLVRGSNTNNLFNNDAYKKLPACDYLTIWFGINDAYTSRSKGGIEDTTNTTFYGAWNILLSYFIANMPNTKIGIIIPYPERKQIEQTDDATAETWQRYLDYVDAARTIARKYGIKVLDLLAEDVSMFVWRDNDSLLDSGIITQRFTDFTYDGTHPNQAGYNFLAPIIMEWLKTL